MAITSINANNGAKFITPTLQKDFQKCTRSLMRYRQFASWDIQKGLQKGKTAIWNVPVNIPVVAPIVEGTTVPVAESNVLQGSCTMQQYIYGVPFTAVIDKVSQQDVQSLVEDQLSVAFGKAVENFGARPAFASTNMKVSPTSATDILVTNTDSGTFSAVNNFALTIDHILSINIEMAENDVEDKEGKFYGVMRPGTAKVFRKQLEDISKYTSEGFSNIVKGKFGEYDNMVFVAQTAVPKQAGFATNNKSDEAFFFGLNTIVELMVQPEKVISNNPSNWGQDMGLGYDALLGHGLVRKDKVYHWTSVV